jgi:putative membrane protein
VGIGVTLIANGQPLTAGGGNLWGFVATLVVTAAVFGLVNGTVGTAVRIVAFPLYILTLGFLALVVNALLLLFVSWLSSLIGFGLQVDGFWAGFWGALILGIISWLLGLLLRPNRR